MKSRLRHPIRAIREPFGKAGLTVAIIALILALGGTALAAGALTGKQKKEVEKIAKKFAGKPGAPGAAGANGTNGTNGKDGTNGSNGADGTNGEDGEDGVPGKSVTKITGASICPDTGGAEFKVEGAASGVEVCKGKEGEKGEKGDPGDPWSVGGTLPSGKSETGGFAVSSSGAGEFYAPISFTIPLANTIPEANIHIGKQGEAAFHSICAGTTNVPTAPAGHLCVYKSTQPSPPGASAGEVWDLDNGNQNSSRAGALVVFTMSGAGYSVGSWAVTAP